MLFFLDINYFMEFAKRTILILYQDLSYSFIRELKASKVSAALKSMVNSSNKILRKLPAIVYLISLLISTFKPLVFLDRTKSA